MSQTQLILDLIKAIENMTGWNIPTAYDGEEDEVGECAYCCGWNMRHEQSCVAVQAASIAARAKKQITNNTLGG